MDGMVIVCRDHALDAFTYLVCPILDHSFNGKLDQCAGCQMREAQSSVQVHPDMRRRRRIWNRCCAMKSPSHVTIWAFMRAKSGRWSSSRKWVKPPSNPHLISTPRGSAGGSRTPCSRTKRQGESANGALVTHRFPSFAMKG